MRTPQTAASTELARRELERRAAIVTLCRRSFADFCRHAIAAGVVDGVRRVEWGPHLDALCEAVQFQLEGWLVANGPPRAAREWPAWERQHAEMIARQRAAWERPREVAQPDGPAAQELPVWEDGEPEPWLRYVLAQNVIWNVPPGTLKSTFAMVLANAWIWLWAPAFSFGAASGVDSNVDRDAKASRDLVKSAWYRETFSIGWEMAALDDADAEAARAAQRLADEELGIKRDTDAVSDWATTAGGKRRSRTVNAGFTGTHVDATFIDDPDDADRVWNESDRLRPQNRFSRAIENRVNCEHRSLRLVLQQRVHVADFTAYLVSTAQWSPRNPKGWAWLCIPARFGRGPAEVPLETPWGWRDWRTQADEMIHPRITAGVIADKIIKLGSFGVSAQYDENPRRLDAGMFERAHARFFVLEGDPIPSRARPDGAPRRSMAPPIVVALDDLDRITLSVDAANSLDPKPGAKVSAVGLGVIGCRGEERFLLDDRTRVLGPSATYRAIFETMHAWDLDCVLVETKALGNGVIDEIQISIRRGWYLNERNEQVRLVGPDGEPVRCKVVPFNPGRDSKEQRAVAMLPPWEQGLILLRDGAPWLYPTLDPDSRKKLDEGLFEEVCTGTAARRNDRIDYLSQVVAHYRGTTDTRSKWKAMNRLSRVAVARGA